MIPNALAMMDSQSAFPSDQSFQELADVPREYRWELYQRLQELNITCQYRAYSPLQVQIHQPAQVIQLWSIIQSLSMSRQDAIQQLETCWNLRTTRGR